jgi:hypothetical protein
MSVGKNPQDCHRSKIDRTTYRFRARYNGVLKQIGGVGVDSYHRVATGLAGMRSPRKRGRMDAKAT